MNARSDVEMSIRCQELRLEVVDLIRLAGTGHMAGSLSAVDFLYVLYSDVLRLSPESIEFEGRDRYLQSKGHAVEALYVVLTECGYLDKDLRNTYLQFGSDLVGHATRKVPGIEQSTGALGHGLSLGVGMAISGKQDGASYRVFVLMGDGELAEGSVWEAAMCASHYKLDNLVAVVDRNGFQIAGRTEDIMNSEPLEQKFRSFGWNVLEIDGHDIRQLRDVLNRDFSETGEPTLIIMNTVKGSGISYMENDIKWHHRLPTDLEYDVAKADINRSVAVLRRDNV